MSVLLRIRTALFHLAVVHSQFIKCIYSSMTFCFTALVGEPLFCHVVKIEKYSKNEELMSDACF